MRETYPDLGRAAAAEKEEISRGPKDFPARVPRVHGSWRRWATGAIAKGYCAHQWDFTVDAAARPCDSPEVPSVPCGQRFDSERWRLLTGFRPAGCAVSTANGRESGRPWGGIPQRGRVSTSRPCLGGAPLRGFVVPLLRWPAEARWIMAEKRRCQHNVGDSDRAQHGTAGGVQRGLVGAWMAACSCLPRSLCEPRVHRKRLHGS